MAKLIVIEGLDGSGKETQAKELKARLEKDGYTVHNITFPNYDSISSGPVRMYLDGELGNNIDDISVYGASAMYSVDRFATYKASLKNLFDEKDSIIIADRYTSSNIIHQAGRINNYHDRVKYYEWLYDLEFNKLELPREDLVVYLDVDTQVSQDLMRNRYKGDESKKDLHERDLEYLLKCQISAYNAIRYFKKIGHNWQVVECSCRNKLRPIESIAKEIHNLVINNLKL